MKTPKSFSTDNLIGIVMVIVGVIVFAFSIGSIINPPRHLDPYAYDHGINGVGLVISIILIILGIVFAKE